MESPRDTLEVALDALAKGIVPVPCRSGSKVPLVRWKEFQQRLPPEDLIRAWFRHECNVAILTNSMVVFDCDDPAEADNVIAECGETAHRLRTPRGGVHLGYRRRKGVKVGNSVKIRGRMIDIRTDGGIEMIPPSVTEHGRYEWVTDGLQPLSELPVASIGWTRERTRKKTRPVPTGEVVGPATQGSIRFPERYCLTIRSVQGQRGSGALVRVVCVFRDAGRTPEQALTYMLTIWNPTCAEPPWSDDEIRYAIRRHYGIASF